MMVKRIVKRFKRIWISSNFSQTLSRKNIAKADSIGAIGESAAAKYLQDRGYLILCRNWRCRIGELDLICSKGREIIFVEVKSRIDGQLSRRHLLDNITAFKRKKLHTLSAIFYSRYVRSYSLSLTPRIDVVGVLVEPRELSAQVAVHIKGAIGAEY